MKAPFLKLRGTFAAACVLAVCALSNPKKHDSPDSNDQSAPDYR